MDTSPEERSSFDHVTHNISATVDEVTLPGALSLARINDAKREVEWLELEASNIKENNLSEMKLDPIFSQAA
ncbi:hypothetical protein MKX01_008247 [Papaver californicum]|nr:hypothetical protein MKX01_008247 [Papaver californicum]